MALNYNVNVIEDEIAKTILTLLTCGTAWEKVHERIEEPQHREVIRCYCHHSRSNVDSSRVPKTLEYPSR